MKIFSLRKSAISYIVGIFSALFIYLILAQNVLAQTTGTTTTTTTTKGGTAAALPNAGTTEITYALFLGGVLLFVIGAIKLVKSFRE